MSVQGIFNNNLVKTLREVVDPVGMGFMMPEYQRPYKWSEENIERLIEDIVGGLSRSSIDEIETLFLGTLIVVQAHNSEFTKYSQNSRIYASPTAIYYVVDGQQRLSTLAILAIILHREINKLIGVLDKKYTSNAEYDVAKTLLNTDILEVLTEFYSISFSGSARPKLKPLILRKTQEFWIRDGSNEYVSPVAKYIADYIESGVEKNYSQEGDVYEILQINQKKILIELKDKLIDHSQDFGTSKLMDISKAIIPESFYQDFGFVLNADRLDMDEDLSTLLKYCLFTLFMSKHCCVNYLEPKTHQWAIEVFQSLNSTGVPLSALEVFKAYVYQNTEIINVHGKLVKEVFGTIEEQMISVNDDSAQHKTDVFLTAFALGFDGEKLGTRYTQQNKSLQKKFSEYIRSDSWTRRRHGADGLSMPMFEYMLHLSKYIHFSSNPDDSFSNNSRSDVQRAYINLLFMRAMNFSTTHPLLAYFYRDDDVCNSEFIDACNATAAFYALWRCSRSSSRLDNVARELMLDGLRTDDGTKVIMNWKKGKQISIQKYKQALKNVLIREDIWDKNKWMSNATNYLTYQNSATLCKYILFLSHHDTIAHRQIAGLLERGSEGTFDFFNGGKWMNPNYNTVEHISPQRPNSNDTSWSAEIYSSAEGNIVHAIGNLTLLPKVMNSIVGNLPWQYKHKFYTYLANPSQERRMELLQLDKSQDVDVTYTKAARSLLNSTSLYFHHLGSLVQISADDKAWTREIIEKRTEFICSLAYDRLTKWLEE